MSRRLILGGLLAAVLVAPGLVAAQQARPLRAKRCIYVDTTKDVSSDAPCSYVESTINGNYAAVYTLRGGSKVTLEYLESSSGWHRLKLNGTPAIGYEINRSHLTIVTNDLKQTFEFDAP